LHLVKTFTPSSHHLLSSSSTAIDLVSSQRQYKDILCSLLSVDMTRSQARSDIKNNEQQLSVLKHQDEVLEVHTACLSWPSVGKQPQGIKKQVVRKSACLQAIENLRKQFTFKSNYIQKVQTSFFPLASNILKSRKVCAFIASLVMPQLWSSQGTTEFADSFKIIRVLLKTKTRARRTRSWKSFFLNLRSVFFEEITNLAFKLHCWDRTEREEEEKGEQHQR